jgi:glyoxylase-like metal-dependent hydrolase (beta-lactamase superfamily II)
MTIEIALAASALLIAFDAAAQPRPAPTRTEVADGVHLFQTAPYGDVGLDGNSVAVIGRDGVLVFDTNGTPAAASAVLAQIRTLTDKPVRYIVNSHWHWDHWYGTEVYRQAFPGVQVVAHAKTRGMMMGPALDFNRPGLETQLPGYVKMLETKAEGDPAVRPRLEAARFFLDQKTRTRHVFPDVTFDRTFAIDLGGRRVQVHHHDRAVTPGDAFLYLPDQKILVTGDLLVNPVPFALSSYPSGWLATLERLDAFDASLIVPGHGGLLRDESLLHATRDVFREILARGREARARGLDVHQARDGMMPALEPHVLRLAGDDASRRDQVRTYVVDWYLHRVYEELDGPLTDAIAPIPPS